MNEPAPHLRGKAPRGTFAGRLLYRLYHRPKAALRAMHTTGYLSFVGEKWGAIQMRRAAVRLPPQTRLPSHDGGTPIVFLTGHEYWHETLFCAHSLLRGLEAPPPVELISDGTLLPSHEVIFRQILPHARIVSTGEIAAQADRSFPGDRFPLIRYYRKQKPILRKLTDVFAGGSGAKLLLDSDMLFYSRPTAMLDWLARPDRHLGMRDIKESYGYSAELLGQLASQRPLPSRLNIGVFGLDASAIDWPRVESWIHVLTDREGLRYNLCQALGALLFAHSRHEVLDEREYRVLPDAAEILQPTAIMHHYVAESKLAYRRHAWRRFVE